MTDSHQKKQVQVGSGFNSIAAAVTGAIVGAGVAIAGAIALKSKKNREHVKRVLTHVKDQAMGYMEDVKREVKSTKNDAKKKLTHEKNKVKKGSV